MSDRIAIIPARGGSRRIPRKNVRPFYGRPIIAYAIENAQRVCSRVIVSTEDAEIAQVARDMGAEVHQRSFEMAKDEVGTQEVAKYVLDELKIDRRARVLVLYPCTPLVDVGQLIGGAMGSRYAVAVGVHPLRDAGAFYWGRCADFRDRVGLYDGHTMLVPLMEEDVVDINVESDWAQAEKRYAEKHGLPLPEEVTLRLASNG